MYGPFKTKKELDDWSNAPLKSATEDCEIDDETMKFKCKSCSFIDLVPKWCVAENMEIEEYCSTLTQKIVNKILRRKSIPELHCPNCDKIMIPLSEFKN